MSSKWLLMVERLLVSYRIGFFKPFYCFFKNSECNHELYSELRVRCLETSKEDRLRRIKRGHACSHETKDKSVFVSPEQAEKVKKFSSMASRLRTWLTITAELAQRAMMFTCPVHMAPWTLTDSYWTPSKRKTWKWQIHSSVCWLQCTNGENPSECFINCCNSFYCNFFLFFFFFNNKRKCIVRGKQCLLVYYLEWNHCVLKF